MHCVQLTKTERLLLRSTKHYSFISNSSLDCMSGKQANGWLQTKDAVNPRTKS